MTPSSIKWYKNTLVSYLLNAAKSLVYLCFGGLHECLHWGIGFLGWTRLWRMGSGYIDERIDTFFPYALGYIFSLPLLQLPIGNFIYRQGLYHHFMILVISRAMFTLFGKWFSYFLFFIAWFVTALFFVSLMGLFSMQGQGWMCGTPPSHDGGLGLLYWHLES